jgi:hypothetical protein
MIPRFALIAGLAAIGISSWLPLTGNARAAAPASAAITAPNLLTASISIPQTTGYDASEVANNSTLVYTLDTPLLWPTRCVSCGDAPFTAFQVQFYVVSIHATSSGMTVATPRLFYTAPKGIRVGLAGVGKGWVVYVRTDATRPPEQSGEWTLVARNIASGREKTLDNQDMEGLLSIGAQAQVVGSTVLWSTWTKGPNGGTSIIRSYNLSTDKGTVVAFGGSRSTWSYTWPDLSGHRVIFEKSSPTYQQILLKDLQTGKTQPLTDASGWNSEPTISGDVAAWKDGGQFDLGKNVIVANLKTGSRTTLRPGKGRIDVEWPVAFGGRYVIFDASHTSDDLLQTLTLYDASAHSRQVLFDSTSRRGWTTGNRVVKGGNHVFLYQKGKSTGPKTWISRLQLVRFP